MEPWQKVSHQINKHPAQCRKITTRNQAKQARSQSQRINPNSPLKSPCQLDIQTAVCRSSSEVHEVNSHLNDIHKAAPAEDIAQKTCTLSSLGTAIATAWYLQVIQNITLYASCNLPLSLVLTTLESPFSDISLANSRWTSRKKLASYLPTHIELAHLN